jgi:adapter protein MecA 1/2
MRLERVSENKIKIMLSDDDLSENNIEETDLWRNTPNVHAFFQELLRKAELELSFSTNCPVAIEIYSIPKEGVVLEITRRNRDNYEYASEVEEELMEKDQNGVLYVFETIDSVIYACDYLKRMGITSGSALFTKDNKYFIYIKSKHFYCMQTLQSILAEFGNKALETVHEIKEYGKLLFEDKCTDKIVAIFLKN